MTEEERCNYQLLLELCAAFNAHDLDRIMAHFAEDSSLDMPKGGKSWGARFTGKDAVRKGLAIGSKRLPTCTMETIGTGCRAAWAYRSGC